MAIFDPFKFEWKGKAVVITPDRRMGAIATVEDFITLDDIAKGMKRRTFALGKLAEAWAALLNYVGMAATSEEVYSDFFANPEAQSSALLAASSLLVLMVPPSALREAESSPPNPTKRRRRAAANS
jgi:hypothetical protein